MPALLALPGADGTGLTAVAPRARVDRLAAPDICLLLRFSSPPVFRGGLGRREILYDTLISDYGSSLDWLP